MSAAWLGLAALLAAQSPAPVAADGPARTRSTRLLLAGGPLAAFGVALGAGAVRYLALGAREADALDAFVAGINAAGRAPTLQEFERAERMRDAGQVVNRCALGFGVAAGVAVLVGAALVGRGLVLRRRARLAPLALPRGGGVAWTLAF